MLEKNKLKVKDTNGKEQIFDILFTFDNEETNKSYIVYTDNTKDSNGKVQVYASIYDPKDPKMKLEEIKTDKEWQYIETILQTLQEEIKEKSEAKDEKNA